MNPSSFLATTTSPSDARNHQILNSANPTLTPLIICFHGSGPNPLTSWETLVVILSKFYCVLLYDRGLSNPSPEEDIPAMEKYLESNNLKPRYVLVAHSYGGAFAKLFLHRRAKDVAGMVLVETGQEGGLSDELRNSLTKKCVLGDLPLVVVRGNSLIRQWKDLEQSEAAAVSGEEKERVEERRKWLGAANAEDERLKKAQLEMSRNGRYVYLADCGHDVVRARPEIVAEEVGWVNEQLISQRRRKSIPYKVSVWKIWDSVFRRSRLNNNS